MDLAKSVSYIFEDEEWVTKVLIVAGVTLGAALLSPILVGLVFVAALNGWTIQLIRNMLDGDTTPMPAWDDFGAKMQLGLQPMIAGVVYFLIPIILSCVIFMPVVFAGAAGNEDAAGLFAGGITCIYVPVLFVYVVIASLFLTVGTIQYAKHERINVYFQFSELWRIITDNSSLTGQLILFLIIVQAVVSLAGSTGIGGLLGLVTAPVTAHLAGQYAVATSGKAKAKPKNDDLAL